MEALRLVIVTLVGLSLMSPGFAADTQQSSRSAGKLRQDQSIDLSQRLKQTEPVVRSKPSAPENFAASADASRLAGVANRHDQLFEIYDADFELLADLDGDGYHHALNVSFDVDVSYDSATVYAKLYLSREGEPWSQYFTTDLFHIDGDSYSDAYEVETELLEGYAPGYYAILIEIYSLDHAPMVASAVLDYHSTGRDIMLEDAHQDEPYESYDEYYYEEVSYSHGAGSMGSLLLFFLMVQVAIAARGFLASTPRKKSELQQLKTNPLRCDPFLYLNKRAFSANAASAPCSNPHVFTHTLRFCARCLLAFAKNALLLEAQKFRPNRVTEEAVVPRFSASLSFPRDPL